MAETPSWLYQYPEVKDDSWLDQYKEVKEKPFLDISETASALGRAATSLPTTTMASLSQVWEGLDNPWKRSEGYFARRQEMQALQDELAKEEEEAAASGDISTVSSTIREATPSLGFSGATLIPSMGAAAGTLALSKSPMAARGAAAATSALMAYRMAGAQFLDDAKDRIDSFFAENLNREPTEQEKEEAYQELLPLARKFGAAEAGPEALGNLALGGAGKYIRRALGGKNGVMELASNALGKVTGTKAALAGAGALVSEIGTEAVTGVEQQRIQKQFEEGVMRGESPESVPLEERTLDDYIKSFKEVAPATMAMTGMMGAAGLGPTAIARGIKALRPTPPERQTQIQKDLQAEAGAIPKDTVPDQTNEEKLAAMEAGGTTVVDPDGKTAVIPPQQPELPSMPSPDEVAVQLNTDAAKSLKAAGSSKSAQAQAGFDATLKEILGPPTEPTIPTLEAAEEAEPEVTPSPTMEQAATPLVDNLPALIAVRDNNATPEQVQSLVEQGLVEQVDGQNIITEAGVAVMPEDQRPKLTPAERAAEVEGMAVPVERDATKPEQMTPEERFNQPPVEPVIPKSFPIGKSSRSTQRRLLAQFNKGLAWAEKNDSERASLSAFQKRNDLLRARDRTGNFGTDRAADDYAFWKGASAFFEAKQINQERVNERNLPNEQKVAQHVEDLLFAFDSKEPVSAAAVDTYGITLPKGYVKQGDLYVFQPGATGETPVQAAPPAAQAVKATAPGPVSQKRAAAGGEIGPNGEWYPGGAFIATTEMPKKQKEKLQKMAKNNGNVEVRKGTREAIKPGFFSPYKVLAGTAMGPQGNVNEAFLANPLGQLSSDRIEQSRGAIARWNAGENQLPISEFPSLANPDAIALAVQSGEAIPGAVLEQQPWLKDMVEKFTPKQEAPLFKKGNPPLTLPAYTSNSVDVAREYGLPDDFYQLQYAGNRFNPVNQRFEINEKYQTNELKSALAELDKWQGSQSINASTGKQMARNRVDSELRRISEAAREDAEKLRVDKENLLSQTATVATQNETAAPSAKGAAVASAVEQPVEGSIPTVGKVSPETEISSRKNLGPEVAAAEQKQAADDEAAKKRQKKQDESTKNSLNSVLDPQKKNAVTGTVTKADVETAREALTNSGEIPNAYLTNVYESLEAFLADKANARLFPSAYARLQTEKNIEGLYENGQTLIFAKQIQVSNLDRNLATMLGLTPEQAAARRVIAHENGHKAISLFTMAEKRELRGYLMRAYSDEQIAKLVETYDEYADWRTNLESRFEALEELLMRDFEKMEKIPTGGVWDDIVQFLKRVWRRLTGQKGEPTLKNLKDVARLMRNAMKRPAVPLGSFTLKDGGKVKLSAIAPTAGITPEMDAEYLAAVEAGDMEKAQRMVDEGKVKMTRRIFDALNVRPELTQRATTIHKRLTEQDIIQPDEFENGKGLVYGDGKGVASEFLGADSYEPFPPSDFQPDYVGDRSAGSGSKISKTYETILNTFVLNVVDPQTRDFIVRDIANLLKKGGRAIIVTRGTDVLNSTPIQDFGNMSRLQKSGSGITYQKGFTQGELVEYLQKTLGEGFAVQPLKGGSAGDVRAQFVKKVDKQLPNPLAIEPRLPTTNIDSVYLNDLQGDSGNDNLNQLLLDASPNERQAVVNSWIKRNPKAAASMQRMVNEAARAAGFRTTPMYHGSSSGSITEFRTDTGYNYGPGAYMTSEPNRALAYGPNVYTVYLKWSNPVLGNFKAPDEFRNNPTFESLEGQTNDEMNATARRLGYDSVVKFWSFRGDGDPVEIVVFSPTQIKSADPVTYDNAGNVIPPSQRFQPTSPDIRFSRPQFASDTDAATSAGNEAARSTIYSERDMDVREAIRRAYEAMPKDTSVAVPIGELFAKTEELMPGVTQDEFSNVLQDLFEDNGAVLQEGEQIIPEQEVEIQAFEKDNPFNELIRKSTEKSPSLGEINGVSKKFVQRVLRPASNFATNNGIRIDDNAPLQVRAMPDGSIIIGYSLSQERFDELQKMAPQAASQYTKDSVIEELIHLSDLIGLRNQWIKSGKKISFDQFVLGEQSNLAFSLIQKADSLNDLEAESLRRILASSLSLYNNNPEIANLSLNELLDLAAQYPYVLPELVRSLIQLKKTGQLTETAFRKIANVLREWQEIVLQWISDGYASAKEGVFGEMLSERIKNAENNLAQFSDTSEINVTTPEGRRAGFVVVMPRAAKASKIPIEDAEEASKSFKVDLAEAGKGRVDKTAKFKGKLLKDTEIPEHNVKSYVLYRDTAIKLIDDLMAKTNDILVVAEALQDPEFQIAVGLQVSKDVSSDMITIARSQIGIEIENRLANEIRKERNPRRKRELELAEKRGIIYYNAGTGAGQALQNRQESLTDPRYRGRNLFNQAKLQKEQKSKDKLDAITGGTEKITDIITKAEEKAAEETTQAEVEAQESAVEDDQDAIDLAAGEATLTEPEKSLYEEYKDILRRRGILDILDKRDASAAKASISSEERNALAKLTKAERDEMRKKDDKRRMEILAKLLGKEEDAKTPEQKKTRKKREKMVNTAKKRAEAGKSLETPQEGETESSEEQVSKAERTAQAILKDLSERYSDPLIIKEKKPNVDAMRELYKERVKQGVGPNQMTEKSFVNKAVELGADEKTAGILWKAAELEIDAREAMRQDKILQRKAVVGERADAQAHRIIFAKERLKRQSGFAGIDTNSNKDTIIQAFRDQVKSPVSLEDFVARLKSLNVSETVAKRLFTAAEREKIDLEAVKKFQAETRALEEIEIAENKASQIIYRFEEQYRQGFKNPPEGMTGKEQRDSIIRAFRDQVKNPTSFEVFAERLAKLKVGNEIAERVFLTASRERADLIRVKDLKIVNRKVEIASKQASRLIYNTEERLRQGSKDLEESKNGDSINKAFRDQISEPVSEKEFKQRLEKLNVPSDVAARLFKTATREKTDLEAMEAFKALEGPDALKRMLNEMNKARPADSVPLERAMPWRKILSSNPKDVAEYRQRIFEAISDLPSFQNLTDEQKERLADLYAEAWENRRQAILDRMLRDEIKKARDRDEISEDVEKKLQQSRNKILEIVNLGGFNNDDLVKILGERYGISASFTEEQRERIQKLADQLQDEDMNTAKRNKLAMEFAVELAGAMDVPVSEIISNWWTSSVLFGPQTIFSIGAAFLNGGYSIATIGTRRMLAKLFKGDIQGAIEESILMLKGFARYLGAFKQSGRRAWNYLWTGDVGLLGTGSTDILNEINNFDQLQRFQRHKLLAEQLAKDPRMVRRYVGVYLRFVSRLLTALDAFNVMVTKAGTASLALRMSGMSTDKIIEAEKMLNLKAYKDQVIRDYFDNKAPKTQAEKALVDSYAEAEMYRAINKLGGKMENADYLASESAMTMQPTGFGGVVYDAITGFFAQRQSNADEYLEKMKKDWISNKDLKAVTFLALAYLRQFAAYNAAGLTGSKFVRYASNKFNQGLSFIPFAGLLRQLEAKDDKIKGKDAFRETIYRNQIVSFVMLMVGYSVIKAIQDEPDDEERGNFWNGGWSNLTPDQKKQMLAKGQKEYTMGFKFNGRWYVFNYQNWPLNQILSAIGSMSDQIRFSPEKWDEKSALSKGVAGMVSGVKSTLEIPALSGLQELVGNRLASKDPTEKELDRLSRVASGWVGGFVPRILKDIDFYTQPELRKYEGLWEKTASHIPIYRRYIGEEYYDILGKQIKRNVIPGSREFMMGPTEPEYKILGALNARNIFLTPANAEYRMIGKGRNRRRLTQEEADAYSLETGRGYRDMLLRYGQRALQMPTERARAFLQDKAEEVRDRALKRAYRR